MRVRVYITPVRTGRAALLPTLTSLQADAIAAARAALSSSSLSSAEERRAAAAAACVPFLELFRVAHVLLVSPRSSGLTVTVKRPGEEPP